MPYQAGELPEVLKVRCSTNAMDGDGRFFLGCKVMWSKTNVSGDIAK